MQAEDRERHQSVHASIEVAADFWDVALGFRTLECLNVMRRNCAVLPNGRTKGYFRGGNFSRPVHVIQT